ncbi:Activin receptor type-2A [Paramuricea clavata]|uniref:Activin receptor type-2A n=1 Tax=Paramuricea clavata TaxID=317549 RepID=A0A7D9D6E9_PARCT|nr:Activin receptor type-2A [Paramuricea clavata]
MNTILQLVLSTFLLLQLGTAAFVPFSKLMNRNRRTVTKQILNNFIDEYESQKTAEDLNSRTCAYYNYEDDCHNSNDGCGEQTETCTGKSSNVGCYTAWDNNQRILQGCWLAYSRTACTPGKCLTEQAISNPHYRGTYFCCCFGDNCNEIYGLSNNIPSWP